jgi:DNA-binding transcriptional regulator/RsmH inhibitor MraZ
MTWQIGLILACLSLVGLWIAAELWDRREYRKFLRAKRATAAWRKMMEGKQP